MYAQDVPDADVHLSDSDTKLFTAPYNNTTMTKGVFLLAGVGSRLRPLTDTTPKPLISVAGRPLIARSVDSLIAVGITELVIVTGHLEDQIQRFFRSSYPGISVTFVHNERYEETNNAYSLLLARQAIDGKGMLLLDGDILYDPTISRKVLGPTAPARSLVVRRSNQLGEEEIKVQLDARGRITQIGKQLPPDECVGESIGIARFDPMATVLLFETLHHRICRLGLTGEFYEASFQQMIDHGMRFDMLDAGDHPCMEIDTPEDLQAAELLAESIDFQMEWRMALP
jgi:choline kinase